MVAKGKRTVISGLIEKIKCSSCLHLVKGASWTLSPVDLVTAIKHGRQALAFKPENFMPARSPVAMLHEDSNLLPSPGLGSSSSSFAQPPSTSSKSIATSIYTMPLDEEDPWGDTAIREPATNTRVLTPTGPYSTGKASNQESSFDFVTIPNIYRQIYNSMAGPHGVSIHFLDQIFAASELSLPQREQIEKLIGNAPFLLEKEFFRFLACIAIAQRGDEVTSKKLYAYRFDPPLPHFDSSESLDDNSDAATETHNDINLDNGDLSHINIDKADTVTVQIAPEKEGYIFKHVMYIVQNSERNSRAMRRYNDFAWLYDAITRRYPTRMIPTLPPKNLGGRTDAFLEKRRKGLSRFLNSLLRHPVLSKDELVHVFFTEPSELGEWKKQNTPSLEEDFARLQIDNASNEATSGWNERFDKAQSRNEQAVKAYTDMCFTMDRIAKRQANQAKDYTRYGASLSSLSELENWCYTETCQRRCNQVRLDSEQVAKHLQKARVKMQNNAEALYADTLEQLKRQRDLCVSFKDLCLRKQKVWGNTLEGLEKRLKANIIKVNQNRGIPGMEAEVEKLDNAIKQDKQAMTLEQKRRAYIAKCIEEEIRYLQEQESYAIILHRNFTQLQAESEQNLLNIWHQLENKLSGST